MTTALRRADRLLSTLSATFVLSALAAGPGLAAPQLQQQPLKVDAPPRLPSGSGKDNLPNVLNEVRRLRPDWDPNNDSAHRRILAELQSLEGRLKQQGKPMTLQQAIAYATDNNPTLLAARESIDAQEWSVTGVRRQWYPSLVFSNPTPVGGQVNTSTTYNVPGYDWGPSGYSPTQTSSYYNFAPQIVATWTFFQPSRSANINSQLELLNQQQYLYLVSLRGLVLNVQQAYYQVQASYELIQAYHKIYDINRRQLQIVQDRYNAKSTDLGTLGQTRTQLYNQLTQLIGYYNQYFVNTANLANAIGLPPQEIILPADTLAASGDWTVSLDESIQRGTRLREEVLASLAQSRSFGWNSEALLASYLPSFGLAATNSFTYTNGSIQQFGVPFSSYSSTATNLTFGLTMNWNLFDGGINAASASNNRSQQRSAEQTARSNQLQVVDQIRTAFSQYQTARLNIESASAALRSAELAQAVARARYDYGVGDITTVVQAVQLLGQAALNRAQSILDYNNAVAQLYRYTATDPVVSGSPVVPSAFRIRPATDDRSGS